MEKEMKETMEQHGTTQNSMEQHRNGKMRGIGGVGNCQGGTAGWGKNIFAVKPPPLSQEINRPSSPGGSHTEARPCGSPWWAAGRPSAPARTRPAVPPSQPPAAPPPPLNRSVSCNTLMLPGDLDSQRYELFPRNLTQITEGYCAKNCLVFKSFSINEQR